MRSVIRYFQSAMSAIAFLTVASTASTAGGLDQDRVYADSFGNLVVESAAGYKRIVVGEGGQAEQLSKYTGTSQPDVDVVYAESDTRARATNDCYRPPALIKGRSYMYGFDEGEIPFQGGACR